MKTQKIMPTPESFVHQIDPNARRLWESTSGGWVQHVTCYSAGDGTLLLVEYPDGEGWDIYTPATLQNNISVTVQAAREALNIKEE